MTPLLSVIIPVFNVENYLSKCLDSIRDQTFKNIEVICIDDNSNDRSPQIMDSYNGLRIQTIHLPKRRGVSYVKNYGISLSKGKYIAFIDSDDTLNPDAYKLAIDELETGGFDFVQFNYKCVYDDLRTEKGQFVEEDKDILSKTDMFLGFFQNKIITNSSCTKVYRRDFVASHHFDEELSIAEDEKFIFDLIDSANSIKLISYWGYNYFQRKSGVTHSGDYKKKMGLLSTGDYFLARSPALVKPFIEKRNIVYALSLFLMVPSSEKQLLKEIRNRIKKTNKKGYLAASNFKGKAVLFMTLFAPHLLRLIKRRSRPQSA